MSSSPHKTSPMSPENPRLFIAANISPEQRSACAGLISNLTKGIRFTKVYPKWVELENLHLTLKFLGATDTHKIPRIIETVGAAALAHEAFGFTLKGLGVFPHEKEPRVLWVKMKKGAKRLADLHDAVDGALARIGV
ncbi:RNA 2',3'-cyclic phosphodiesterase, partial [bacterium]|nr:RNA 2',3'-cyclic phosphodiesterase [bacterium]